MNTLSWTAVIVAVWTAVGVLVGFVIGRAVRLRDRGDRS